MSDKQYDIKVEGKTSAIEHVKAARKKEAPKA
jgi:hypothetical protein